jgi:uncharacterized membrane protein YoaK (UPF0700 family)
VLLLGLTTVSGIVDATAYLGFGHVFVVNMTGNIVILGLALGGTAGFTTIGGLVSLAAFITGTVVSGRLARLLRWWPLISLMIECALIAVAAAVAFTLPTARYPVIAILALAMGMRMATVRLTGVTDITTTVITSTLAWLGTHAPLAGGVSEGGTARRIAAVVLLLVGAAFGAWLTLHAGSAVALLTAAIVQALAATSYVCLPRPPRPSE